MSIKLSPLILFLILLVVLVISIVFGNMLNMEGFVSFGYNVNNLNRINIPQYNTTSSVYKLYDNIFYDNKNGNLIEIDATSYSGNTDLTGSTINSLYVTPRDGITTTIYNNQISGNTVLSVNTDKSMLNTLSPSYSCWIYPTQSNNTDKYTAIYLPWNDSTYVHLINNTNNMNIGTYMFGPANTMSQNMYTNSNINLITTSKNTTVFDTYVTDRYYDMSKNLYKISDYIEFDVSNANLIIQQNDGSIIIYDRFSNAETVKTPGTISNTTSKITNSSFSSWLVTDTVGQNLVLYIRNALKTLVAVIQYDVTQRIYNLVNVCRFNENGLDKGDAGRNAYLTTNNPLTQSPTIPSSTNSLNFNTSNTNTDNIPNNALSEYFKWYWFYKTNQNKNSEFSEDYILKTQIVPPVCPSCPACPSCPGGVCGNCGGQGGSGTLSTTGNTVVKSTNIPGAVASLGTTAGDVAGKTIDATGKLVGGASGLGEKAVTGTVGLAKETAGGAVGLAKETVGGAVGLAKETVGGAVGLVKEAGAGLKDLLKSNPTDIRRNQIQSSEVNSQYQTSQASKYGTQTTGADNYSYYGALPPKSSNFMPITADFSAFGK
jgi:hypothetical protein